MKTIDTMIYRERDKNYIFSLLDHQDMVLLMEYMQDIFGSVLTERSGYERLHYSFEDLCYMDYEKCGQINASNDKSENMKQSGKGSVRDVSFLYMALHLFRVAWELNDDFFKNYSVNCEKMYRWERQLINLSYIKMRKNPALMSCASYYYRDAQLHLFDRMPDYVDCSLIDKVEILPKQIYGIFPGNSGWEKNEKAYIYFDTSLIVYLNEWNKLLIFIYRIINYAPVEIHVQLNNIVRKLMESIYLSINNDITPHFLDCFVFGTQDALAIHEMNVQQIQFIMAHEFIHLNNQDCVTSLENEVLTDKMAYEWTALNVGCTDLLNGSKIDLLEAPYISSMEEFQIDAIKSLFLFYKYYHICNDLLDSENYRSVIVRFEHLEDLPDSVFIKFIKEYLRQTLGN